MRLFYAPKAFPAKFDAMFRHLIPTGVLLLAACEVTDAADAPSTASTEIGGHWVRTEPSGDLRIVRVGDRWRVSIVAGGLPRGMATATPCYGEAIGTLSGDTLTAQLVPFENDEMSVRPEDLDQVAPGPVTIRFNGPEANVDDQGMADFCGLGSLVDGVYRKAP